MDASTLRALNGSIKKWEKIVAGTGLNQGAMNCPLCIMFNSNKNDLQCVGCPVSVATERKYCRGSPYAAYTAANTREDRDKHAKRELEFLKSLLPKGPLNTLAAECRAANEQWWRHPKTGELLERNKGEMLCLIHSEISECMEGERKNLMDDKLPHRRSAEVELADALIRIFDYAGAFGYDLDGAVAEKRDYNATRADHTPEARLAAGGKQW